MSGNGLDLSTVVDALEEEIHRVERKLDTENAKVLAEVRDIKELLLTHFTTLSTEMVRLTQAVLSKK